MSLFDRLSGQLGALWDDVRLPERLDQSIALAEKAIQEGKGAQALALLDGVESERPGLWRVALVRGLAFESIGQYQRAAGSLTLAAEKRDVPLVRLALGRVAEGLDDLRSARDHYEQALEQRPNEQERVEVLGALAGVFERLGRPAAAVPALRHLLRAAPDDATLMLRLAHALQDDGEVDSALDALEPAIALNPPPNEALLLAGRLHLQAQEFAQAQLRFTRVLHADATNAEALEGSGDVARRQGSVANALPLYHQALASAPLDSHGRLHYRIAQCFSATDDATRALDALRASLALDRSERERLAFGASLALQVGELDEALHFATEAIAGDEDNRALRALVGRVHLARGEIDQARQRLSTLRAARMSVDELHAIGELSLRVGDPIEAIALLREASVREPGRAGLDRLLEEAAASLAPELPELAESASPTSLAPFLDALSEAVAAHPLLADLIPRATALRQHLDTPLTVAVLGEFNAGKSTVINTFVGEDMVAMGVLPTTSHVNVIRYGPRKVARWTHHDGTVEELPYSEAVTLVKREPQSIASLEFCYPHPDLRRVHFWDTPGFNAPDDAHEFRAQEALERADAVVWMLDANQALTWSEYERLQVINNRAEKLLVVVNKVDRLDGDQNARKQIEAHIREGLQDEMIGLFFLSARDALAARKAAPDEAPPESTGWPALAESMETRVFDRAGRLKALEVQRGLTVLLTEGVDRANASVTRVTQSATALREERMALQARAARWNVDVVERGHDRAVTALREVRLRGVRDVLQLATPQPGLFSRQRLVDDDVALLRDQIIDRARAAWRTSLEPVLEACNAIDDALVRTVEETASGLPTTDARAVRRRLEGWLTETSALRRLLVERGVAQPMSLVIARVEEFGGDLLRRLGSDPGRTEAERESLMHRLIPTPGASYAAMLDEWGAEYLSAARRLSDHVERDLDILTLDVEQRITRPFQAVLSALHAPPTEVE